MECGSRSCRFASREPQLAQLARRELRLAQ